MLRAALLTLVTGLAFASSVPAQVDATCPAFITNGKHSTTFHYYRFYDFRNLSPGNSTQSQTQSKTPSPSAERIVSDASWIDDWYLRDYPRKSAGPPVIPVHFEPSRVKIVNAPNNGTGYSTYLSMTTERISVDYQEGGEITFTDHNVSYASIRISARVSGASGAVFGFFTYYDDKTESDIEISTQDPAGIVRYSNQPAYTGDPDWLPIPGATVNKSIPDNGKWTDWHVHRLDWLPGRSVFYVDDVQLNETTTNVPRPVPASRVYVDIFGANSSWTGPMEIGKSAEVQIQWIEMLFNSTSPSMHVNTGAKPCKVGSDDPHKHSVASSIASLGLWTIGMMTASLVLVCWI